MLSMCTIASVRAPYSSLQLYESAGANEHTVGVQSCSHSVNVTHGDGEVGFRARRRNRLRCARDARRRLTLPNDKIIVKVAHASVEVVL